MSLDTVRHIRSVVVADPCEGHRRNLASALNQRRFDVWLVDEVSSLLHLVKTRSPDLVVVELRLRDGTWRDVLAGLDARKTRTVILTDAGSVATAVAALKLGVANYLLKPVTADQLISAVATGEPSPWSNHEHFAPLSLDRAIWEWLYQAVESCGSIAGAARMLRLHRRSLRRMLQKAPPP